MQKVAFRIFISGYMSDIKGFYLSKEGLNA